MNSHFAIALFVVKYKKSKKCEKSNIYTVME